METARVLEHVQYSILPHLGDIDKLRFNAICKALHNPGVVCNLRFDAMTRAAYQLARDAMALVPRKVVYITCTANIKHHVNICVGHYTITIKLLSELGKERCTKTLHIHTRGKNRVDVFNEVRDIMIRNDGVFKDMQIESKYEC